MRSFVSACAALFALTFVSAPVLADAAWTDRVKFKGDVRLRHESIDEDGEADRRRMRFRARLGLSAQVTNDVTFVFQLATGGDSPVSTNQSFDNGFSTKDIGVNLAYVDWKIRDGVNFYGGKMKNPLFSAGSAQLVWDSDLNPEGLALTFTSGDLFATAGGFSVEERASADDSILYVVQAGYEFPLGDDMTLTAGAGYFVYTETIGNEPFYDGSAKGNSVDVNGTYVYEYRNIEAFLELGTILLGWPLKVYAHYTRNGEVSQEDAGYAFGAKIGSAKSRGRSEFSWTYKDIEADAVIGTFSESDFGGGGTDADGHVLKAKYALSERVIFGGSLFINDVDRFRGIEHDYTRLQLDVEFKFD